MKPAINSSKIAKLLFTITLWLIAWFLSQGIFIAQSTPLAKWLMNGTAQNNLVHGTIWTVGIMIIGVSLWHLFIHDYRFLKPKNPKVLLAYLLPLALFLVMLTKPLPFGISPLVYTACMVVACFWQDLLTFGFLQTQFEKLVSNVPAAVLTATLFFAGHLHFELSWLVLFYAVGFMTFAYARYRTKSIYLTNAFHLAFLMIAF